MTFTVSPRLAEFSKELVPLEEILAFYRLPDDEISKSDNANIPHSQLLNFLQRPYTWSNSVQSVDGVMHFLEPDAKDVSDIALKRVHGIGHLSLADFRLLNSGWMFADAVLITGQIIRDEKEASCRISFQDLLDHRQSVLHQPTRQPIQLILSDSCNMDFETHPIFNSLDLVVIVITSDQGKARGEDGFLSARPDNRNRLRKLPADGRLAHEPEPGTVTFVAFDRVPGSPPGGSHSSSWVDLEKVMSWLRTHAGIRRLDVSAGGTLIRRLIDLKLLDELRITQAGQIAGFFNSNMEPRPTLFPRDATGAGKIWPPPESFQPNNSPLLAYKGVRLIGEHFIFIRSVLEYRH
ncbi:hypothetical protein DFJ73DRAFT_816322 [Zopfochytrium polystomum]|nr:hypothetical protein DFJ73DRAFT_816322 [Zopfochytrium polystomum]